MTNNNPYLKISKIYLALQRVQEKEVINLKKTSILIPGLIVSIFLLFGQTRAADVTPPLITNVYVLPNPFSPNGDGRADITQINFSVSELTYITMNVAGFILVDSTLYSTGANSYSWGGSGLADGTYEINIFGCDTAGNSSDTITALVTIDVIPPNIISLAATPNPFSPDNNGINDYCRIEFDVTHTHPPDFDEYFIPNKIGRISIWNDGTTHWTFTPDNTPVLPSFPVYFTLFPHFMSPGLSSITMHFLDWSSQIVDAQVSTEPDYYRVGDLTNKMDTVSFWIDDIPEGDSAEIDLYAFTGNAVIEIYDFTGTLVHHVDFWEVFKGNGDYFTLWGPGPIPDGLYNVKIIVEDEAYNIDVATMDVIANSIPTTVYDVYTELPIISPENQDNRYDITYIHYTLSEPVITSIKIFNSPTEFDSTHLVRTLVDGEQQSGGPHAVLFDGRNDAGEFIASGCDSTYYVAIKVIDPLTGDADFKITTIEIDNELPGSPVLDPLPSPTNDPTAVLTGTAEPGDSVKIFLNSILQGGLRADSITGRFFFTLHHEEGQNSIYAISYDNVINASDTSNILYVLYDIHVPELVEVYPQDSSFVGDTLSFVFVRIYDTLSGIDLSRSTIVVKKYGQTIPGTSRVAPPDTIYYELADPLTLGDEATYAIYITAFDSINNMLTDSTHFIFDAEPPQISITPQDSSSVNQVNNITLYISDHVSGANLSLSSISITGPTGLVSGFTSSYDATIVFTPDPPIATDGSDDGRYWIEAIGFDNAGNSDTLHTTFIYDTRVPRVLSTYPQSDEILSSPIARVWILLTDSIIPGRTPSGINFAVSSIVLKDGSGDLVPGNKLIHRDTLIWQLSDTLDTPGSYYIYSSFRDFAGNQGSDSIPFYVFECPIIVYTYPEEGDTISEPLASVSAIIKDQTRTGLISNSVCLLKDIMDTVPGMLHTTDDSIFTWVLTNPLAKDGSDNGEYIVSVNAENGAGYSVNVKNHFHYMYDIVPPFMPILPPMVPAETCEDTITIKGKAEPGSLVKLFLNYWLKDSTYSGTDSIFQFPEIKLIFGEMNYFGIVAIDSFDNTSDTLKFTIMASIPAFAVSLPKPFNEDNYELLISIPEDGEVITQIYDLMSGLVWDESHTLKKGLRMPIYWYGLKNNDGRQVNNGIYVIIVTAKYNSGRIDKLKKLIAVVR